jgi:hypothetical protein
MYKLKIFSRFRRSALELAGTLLMVFAFLAVYKAAGVHEWWIQLVGSFA